MKCFYVIPLVALYKFSFVCFVAVLVLLPAVISADLSTLQSDPETCSVEQVAELTGYSPISIIKAENDVDGYFVGTNNKLLQVTEDGVDEVVTHFQDHNGASTR